MHVLPADRDDYWMWCSGPYMSRTSSHAATEEPSRAFVLTAVPHDVPAPPARNAVRLWKRVDLWREWVAVAGGSPAEDRSWRDALVHFDTADATPVRGDDSDPLQRAFEDLVVAKLRAVGLSPSSTSFAVGVAALIMLGGEEAYANADATDVLREAQDENHRFAGYWLLAMLYHEVVDMEAHLRAYAGHMFDVQVAMRPDKNMYASFYLADPNQASAIQRVCASHLIYVADLIRETRALRGDTTGPRNGFRSTKRDPWAFPGRGEVTWVSPLSAEPSSTAEASEDSQSAGG